MSAYEYLFGLLTVGFTIVFVFWQVFLNTSPPWFDSEMKVFVPWARAQGWTVEWIRPRRLGVLMPGFWWVTGHYRGTWFELEIIRPKENFSGRTVLRCQSPGPVLPDGANLITYPVSSIPLPLLMPARTRCDPALDELVWLTTGFYVPDAKLRRWDHFSYAWDRVFRPRGRMQAIFLPHTPHLRGASGPYRLAQLQVEEPLRSRLMKTPSDGFAAVRGDLYRDLVFHEITRQLRSASGQPLTPSSWPSFERAFDIVADAGPTLHRFAATVQAAADAKRAELAREP